MKKLLVAAILCGVASCGVDQQPAPPECTDPTVYLGVEHDCNDGAGVCVDIGQGAGVECLSKFDPAAGCDAGEWAYSIATDVAHVSFCHAPITGVRDPVEW